MLQLEEEAVFLALPSLTGKLPSAKRKEENLKLTLNWGFKFLQDQLQLRLSLTEKEAEQSFFDRYFTEVARSTGIERRRFAKPTFTKRSRARPKSFNANFLNAVCRSKLFLHDIKQAFDNHFAEAMKEMIAERLGSMVKKWEEELKKGASPEDGIRRVCSHLLKCSKLKMPWSLSEAFQALKVTQRTLSLDT